MADTTSCAFCEIVAGRQPAAVIYEDDRTLAFLDIAPVRPGHALIVPKVHYPSLFEVPGEVGRAMWQAARVVGRGLLDALGAKGLNVGMNVGRAAGQEIMHAHLHLIPRRAGDGLALWSQQAAGRNELATLAADIADAIGRSRTAASERGGLA